MAECYDPNKQEYDLIWNSSNSKQKFTKHIPILISKNAKFISSQNKYVMR